MTRQQMKAMARAQLGNQIFGNAWLIAVVVVVIQMAVTYLVNAIPCVGQIAAILLAGPVSYGVASMFLKQTRTGEKMDIPDIINGFKEDFSNTFLIGLMTHLILKDLLLQNSIKQVFIKKQLPRYIIQFQFYLQNPFWPVKIGNIKRKKY